MIHSLNLLYVSDSGNCTVTQNYNKIIISRRWSHPHTKMKITTLPGHLECCTILEMGIHNIKRKLYFSIFTQSNYSGSIQAIFSTDSSLKFAQTSRNQSGLAMMIVHTQIVWSTHATALASSEVCQRRMPSKDRIPIVCSIGNVPY